MPPQKCEKVLVWVEVAGGRLLFIFMITSHVGAFQFLNHGLSTAFRFLT